MLSRTKWLCSRRRRPLPRVMSSDNGDLPAAGRGRPRLVVFDFDNTLYAGDSGTQLVTWLIRQNWWRVIAAVLISPVIAPLWLCADTRRRANLDLSVDRHCRRLLRRNARRYRPICGRRTRAFTFPAAASGHGCAHDVSTCWRSSRCSHRGAGGVGGHRPRFRFKRSCPRGRQHESTLHGRTHHRSTLLRRTKSRHALRRWLHGTACHRLQRQHHRSGSSGARSQADCCQSACFTCCRLPACSWRGCRNSELGFGGRGDSVTTPPIRRTISLLSMA